MTDFTTLRSGKAIVCHKDHRCDQGVGTVWYVLLSDGYLLECGHEPVSEARANILAEIINAGGEDQWQRVGRVSLKAWKAA